MSHLGSAVVVRAFPPQPRARASIFWVRDHQREKTGKGTMVSTSLMANGLWWNAIQVQASLSGARVEPRPSRDEPATALANLYRCADGRWFLLNVLNDDRDWPVLLRAIARPDLAADPRFATTPARRANARALVPLLDSIFATRTFAEWQVILNDHGLTFGVVAMIDDVRTDRQMVASAPWCPSMILAPAPPSPWRARCGWRGSRRSRGAIPRSSGSIRSRSCARRVMATPRSRSFFRPA